MPHSNVKGSIRLTEANYGPQNRNKKSSERVPQRKGKQSKAKEMCRTELCASVLLAVK